jgi:hypothetical protein
MLRTVVTMSWSTILCMAAGMVVYAQTPTWPFPEPPPQLKSAVDAALKSCKGDLERLCPNKTGPDAVSCLIGNEENVSSECRQALPKGPKFPGQKSPSENEL